MLIDFHTHAFPDAIAPRALDVLIGNMEKVQGYSIPALADGTAAGLLKMMDAQRVDISVLLPIATKPTQAESVNKFAKGLESERIIPFGSVHPAQEDWERTLEGIAETGFRGIKLHPEFQGFFVDSKEGVAVLKKAAELGLIVVYHAGEDMGYLPPVRATPERLRRAMDAAPGATVVAAHMGGMRMWNGVAKYLMDTPAYLDTSYVAKEIPPDVMLGLIRLRGADRVLFASDSPWCLPRTECWAFLEGLGLSEGELSLIAHGNAERLLGLQKHQFDGIRPGKRIIY